MSYRIAYGSLAIALLLLVVSADAYIAYIAQETVPYLAPLLRRGSLVPLTFTVVMIAAAAELIRLMRSINLEPHGRWAMTMVAALMLAPWLHAGNVLSAMSLNIDAVGWQLTLLAAAVLGVLVLEVKRGARPDALANIGATLLVVVYCGFLASFLVLLRCYEGLRVPHGAWLVLIVLAVTKASDIGAYFTGSAIGRHKLIPAVSPGKTVEGALGGAAASILVGLLLWYSAGLANTAAESVEVSLKPAGYVSWAAAFDDILGTLSHLTALQVIVFAALMSVFGQVGDLIESVIKRATHAKDSAQLIPEFGGILDIVDSPTAAAPVAWLLLTCVWAVV